MQYDYGPGGAYFLVCMVYLKAYSLTLAKINIAIVMTLDNIIRTLTH